MWKPLEVDRELPYRTYPEGTIRRWSLLGVCKKLSCPYSLMMLLFPDKSTVLMTPANCKKIWTTLPPGKLSGRCNSTHLNAKYFTSWPPSSSQARFSAPASTCHTYLNLQNARWDGAVELKSVLRSTIEMKTGANAKRWGKKSTRNSGLSQLAHQWPNWSARATKWLIKETL